MDKITVSHPDAKPYVCAGSKCYVIGSQNASFPQHGEHMPHEMWGIWAPPVKLLDGYWIKLNGEWLLSPYEYTVEPFGNEFKHKSGEVGVVHSQFVPDRLPGLVIALRLSNESEKEFCANLEFAAASDLQGAWLSERLGIKNGADAAFFENNTLTAKDELNPWYVMIRPSLPAQASFDTALPQQVYGDAASFSLTSQILLAPGQDMEVFYWIAGSDKCAEHCENVLNALSQNHRHYKNVKIERMEKLALSARLCLEKEPLISRTYEWAKFNTDWLWLETDAGQCVAAGFPEFPWWFGHDCAYIIPAMLMCGEYERSKSSLRTIKKYSQKVNGNGRVAHEVTTHGVVFYEGMLTEIPLFTDIVWLVCRWTGDLSFLKEMYDFCKQGMEWMYSENCPHDDGLPEGYGATEIAELNVSCCDSAVFGLRGLECLSEMAEALGLKDEQKYYLEQFNIRKDQFENSFWMEEYGVYADMVAFPGEIIERANNWKQKMKSFPITDDDGIDGTESCTSDKTIQDEKQKARADAIMDALIKRAERLDPNKKAPWLIFDLEHTILPVEFGYCDRQRSLRIMERMKFRDISKGIGVDRILEEYIFPIMLNHRIAASCNTGSPDIALKYIRYVADTFMVRAVGSTSEISPDRGCFVQAWNSYTSMWPFINNFFGVIPDTHKKTMLLNPCMPEQFNKLKLLDVSIGTDKFNFSYENDGGSKVITVSHKGGEWKIINTKPEYVLKVL